MTLEAVKRRCAMTCSGYSLGFGWVSWRRAHGRERLRSHAGRLLAQGHSGSPGDRGKARQSTAQPIKGCWNQVPFFCRPEPHPPSTGIGRQVADIESQLPGGDACSHRLLRVETSCRHLLDSVNRPLLNRPAEDALAGISRQSHRPQGLPMPSWCARPPRASGPWSASWASNHWCRAAARFTSAVV